MKDKRRQEIQRYQLRVDRTRITNLDVEALLLHSPSMHSHTPRLSLFFADTRVSLASSLIFASSLITSSVSNKLPRARTWIGSGMARRCCCCTKKSNPDSTRLTLLPTGFSSRRHVSLTQSLIVATKYVHEHIKPSNQDS